MKSKSIFIQLSQVLFPVTTENFFHNGTCFLNFKRILVIFIYRENHSLSISAHDRSMLIWM